MKRKVMVVSFVILLLLPSTGMLCSEGKPKILFDEHYARWKPSKHLIDFSEELQKKGYSVEFSDEWMGSLSPSKYDTLVLFIPFRYFHDTEKEAIKSFVENGGGLIIFGEHGGYMDYGDITSSVNSISEMFGIEFSQDVVLDSEKNREDIECHTIISTFASHPVTKGIKDIGYICGCSLEVKSRAIKLAFGNFTTNANGKKGKDVVVLAAAEYGKGRVVAVGDTDFLVGSSTRGYEEDDFLSIKDNKKLGLNMFEWTIQKVDITDADALAKEGNTYFSQGKYSQAKLKFENALDIYSEADAREKVAEMQDMINECDKGLDADAAFQNGMDYYDQEEYNTAIAEFEESELLYSGIGDSRRSSEAQVWIETCYKALKRHDAEDAYGMGEEYYNEGHYESALAEFEKSKSLYSELGDSGNSSEAQSMIDTCNKALNAEAAYRDGMEYYNSGKYELAISKFEEAIPLYRELGNDAKAQELENKKEEAQEAKERRARRNRMLGVIGILVAVVCAFLAVFIFLKQPGTQKRPETPYPDVVYCTSCGKENVKGALFCRYCKTPLKPSDELEKERILKDLRRKFEDGEITEEEYRKLVKDLEESL